MKVNKNQSEMGKIPTIFLAQNTLNWCWAGPAGRNLTPGPGPSPVWPVQSTNTRQQETESQKQQEESRRGDDGLPEEGGGGGGHKDLRLQRKENNKKVVFIWAQC